MQSAWVSGPKYNGVKGQLILTLNIHSRSRESQHVSQYTLEYNRGFVGTPFKAYLPPSGYEGVAWNDDDGESISRFGLY